MSAERQLAHRVAAAHGLPDVSVSTRSESDLPGVGTGHWARRVAALAAEVDAVRHAVAAAPAGVPRDELDRAHDLIDRRLVRFTRIAEVGQALLPDDDRGGSPRLTGAAAEIDGRLVNAASDLATLAAALAGEADAGAVRATLAGFRSELARPRSDDPDERA